MLEVAGKYDALLCGDDAITRMVLERSIPRLKVISKYGIGLDRIDLTAATELKIPVLFTPGVNHTTVAEHTFALMLALVRNIVTEANNTAAGNWIKITGHDLRGKIIGIVGLGRIGQEVAKLATAFGMQVLGYGTHWDPEFTSRLKVERVKSLGKLLQLSDIVTLHTKLQPNTRHLINAKSIRLFKKGAVLINTSRGDLVDNHALLAALDSHSLLGYAADVLDQEPPPKNHPLLGNQRVILTPHIGSRTFESVQRQATCAIDNLVLFLSGNKPVARAC